MHLLFVLVIVALMGCQQSMPTRKVYLPADCPTPEALISPAAHHHKKPTTKPATKPQQLANKATTKTTVKPTTTRQPQQQLSVNLNTATQAQLEALPGIGPALAKRIMERRDRRPFKRIAQLRYVKGIGPAKFKRLKPHIRVQDPQKAKP